MTETLASAELYVLAERLGETLGARGLTLATAESCTGGWAAMAVTSVPGSSRWFERGFVAYSNTAKQEMLGVDAAILAAHGAVSEQAVHAMARGALDRSAADASLAISGVAGPGGGSAAKPVGLVCLGFALRDGTSSTRSVQIDGGREQIRRAAVALAFQGLIELVSSTAAHS
ncbi:MAG: nicotinamide-nucleotide amidohydrolase family protein [Gammaproteobacteria bacterium]|nr:nicotinamide-nucleotide amidohydrolase family protein [Gammaproteobacteria bacterium]